MPSQRRFFHSKGAKKAGITKEFDRASKGMRLPAKKQDPLMEALGYRKKK